MSAEIEDKDEIKEENIEKQKDKNKADYEILLQDFSYFDLSFKLIVIGDSGKKIFLYN